MYKLIDKIFDTVIKLLTLFSLLILVFIIIFIFKESIVFFKEVSILKFITGRKWNPLKSPTDLSILNIILGTLYVSFVAIIIALPIGVGTGLLLSIYTNGKWKVITRGIIDILAGIPSVVYGFIGLLVIVKFFEAVLDFPTGESVLAGGILLSVMILPYIISTCSETMDNIYKENLFSSEALGTSKIYMARKIVLPESKKGIIAAVILALGRAMGETMAVMMVMGNTPISPKLLKRAQTIPSLIALEMGMAEVGSLHYHALFASGLVLMVMLLIINIIFYYIKKGIHVR
ncbi:MAG: phosphate ABC transporter permease subunit PstC [Alkaliphilus sp.]|nr:phosphate ABC transporter permease subunit PstC [Alkaliphilus sp.]